MDRSGPITLEILVPVYNEQDALPELFDRIEKVFSSQALESNQISSVRTILVDDGSSDQSARVVRERIEKGFQGTMIRLSRNFGHQNALTAGMSISEAQVLAVIDADLQDPPEAILEMIRLWREGYDVVYGQRTKRKEPYLKVFCYWAFYRLLGFLADSKIPLDSGDFCVLDKRIVRALNDLPERLRFPRGLRAWVGFRQVAYVYERERRVTGKSKYRFSALYKLAVDGIAACSTRPLKVAQVGTFFLGGMLVVTVFLFLSVFFAGSPKFNDPTLLLLFCAVLISVVGFATLITLYVLCGYVGRIYLEVKGRPPFIVQETVGQNGAASVRGAA